MHGEHERVGEGGAEGLYPQLPGGRKARKRIARQDGMAKAVGHQGEDGAHAVDFECDRRFEAKARELPLDAQAHGVRAGRDDERKASEIGERECTARLAVSVSAHEKQRFGEQAFELDVRGRRRVVEQGEVEPALAQPFGEGARETLADGERGLGQLLSESARQRHREQAGQARRQADRGMTGQPTAGTGELLTRASEPMQDGTPMLEQERAGLGWLGAAPVAQEKRLPEFDFKLPNLPRQRRLGHSEEAGGAREAADFGDTHEGFDLLEIHEEGFAGERPGRHQDQNRIAARSKSARRSAVDDAQSSRMTTPIARPDPRAARAQAPAPPPALRALTSMATCRLHQALILELSKRNGPPIQLEALGGVDVERRVADGEAVDLVLLALPALERLAQAGRVVATSIVPIAISPTCVAVAEGAPATEISTLSALQAALLQAKSIGVSTGPSGRVFRAALERLGLAEQIAPRLIEAPPGVPVAALIAEGRVDIGLQQASELVGQPGVRVLGPLPPEVAIDTVFAGAVAASSQQSEAAASYLRFAKSPAARQWIEAEGMRPVEN